MKRAARVECQSCDDGKVTYPASPTLDGGTSPEIVGWCLACNGHGHFIRDGKSLTYAGPMKEEECPQ